MKVPKCQLPSTTNPTLPLYLHGTSSSIAANIAVYSPPTATPVNHLQTQNITKCFYHTTNTADKQYNNNVDTNNLFLP